MVASTLKRKGEDGHNSGAITQITSIRLHWTKSERKMLGPTFQCKFGARIEAGKEKRGAQA